MDWLLRPVMKGVLKYEHLKDGTMDLYDVDLLNDKIDVDMKNEVTAHKLAAKK